ncbi:hypothetical protein PIB30_069748 [Stylosanthes scabra]|uniref:Uncharacterized protein n=1 Tax=Stylosanthes scabra TaxID=79078 RepID=A0ABU6TMY5_9FABA|nr:hypothetical protein [Stylosanthes scabra]
MGWGFSLRIFQTFQVQVQAWKVAKYVVDRCGLDSPDVRFFNRVSNGELEDFYESESSVCSAAVLAERVRGAVSHIGVLQFLVSDTYCRALPSTLINFDVKAGYFLKHKDSNGWQWINLSHEPSSRLDPKYPNSNDNSRIESSRSFKSGLLSFIQF